jgi:hypothetical protein
MKIPTRARYQKLWPIILGTWEAEIERIMAQDQLRQKVRPYLKK